MSSIVKIGQSFVTSFINLLVQIPDDIVINIFKYDEIKLKMIIIFPWLSEYIPKCDFCEEDSCFLLKFDYTLERCDTCDTYNEYDYDTESEYYCSFKKHSSYYDYDGFKVDKNYNINIDVEDHEWCTNCENIIYFIGKLTGMQIQLLPSNNKK